MVGFFQGLEKYFFIRTLLYILFWRFYFYPDFDDNRIVTDH